MAKMAETEALLWQQKAENTRLRAELARPHPVTGWTAADMDHAVESWQVATARAERAEAAIARVRDLCDVAHTDCQEEFITAMDGYVLFLKVSVILRALDGE